MINEKVTKNIHSNNTEKSNSCIKNISKYGYSRGNNKREKQQGFS